MACSGGNNGCVVFLHLFFCRGGECVTQTLRRSGSPCDLARPVPCFRSLTRCCIHAYRSGGNGRWRSTSGSISLPCSGLVTTSLPRVCLPSLLCVAVCVAGIIWAFHYHYFVLVSAAFNGRGLVDGAVRPQVSLVCAVKRVCVRIPRA